MKLRLRSSAQQEIADAALWYDSESEGLGRSFLDEIDRTLRRITDFPLMYQFIRPNTRRTFIKHFPYVIFYTVNDDEIVIVGCYHMRRDPQIWQNA